MPRIASSRSVRIRVELGGLLAADRLVGLCGKELVEAVCPELVNEDLGVLNLERDGHVDVHHHVVRGRAVLHGRVVRAGLPRDDVRDPVPRGPEGDEPRREQALRAVGATEECNVREQRRRMLPCCGRRKRAAAVNCFLPYTHKS